MSSVRMCDNCGIVFSERSDNWSTGEISINKKDPDTGRIKTETVSVDRCTECTEGATAKPPSAMIPGGTRGEYLT